jgi:predicted SprT family Zn-dependent metalloprotease
MGEWDWRAAFLRFAEVQADAQREQEIQEAIKREIAKRTWYTAKQAADYLGVDYKEFRERVVNAGAIPTLGNRISKIHHADFSNYVISQRQRKGKK